jgi:hypothetical protein
MNKAEIQDFKDFFYNSIFKFYRIGLQVSGKNFDNVILNSDGLALHGKPFW